MGMTGLGKKRPSLRKFYLCDDGLWVNQPQIRLGLEKKKYRKPQFLNEIHHGKPSTAGGHYSLMRKKNIWVLCFKLFVAKKKRTKTSATHETISLGSARNIRAKDSHKQMTKDETPRLALLKQGNSEGRNPPNSD